MSTNDGGGPAFPSLEYLSEDSDFRTNPGMSLRDWFAGTLKVDSFEDFPQTIGDYRAAAKAAGIDFVEQSVGFWAWVQATAAFEAKLRYVKADAMIAERKKPCSTPS